MGDIIVVRHGPTEWSASGRHTSMTDLDLTTAGEQRVAALAPILAPYRFAAVLSSPMRRALHTARLAGLTVSEVTEDLYEWDYGRYEGLTTPQIRQDAPGWTLWEHGCPDGESPAQVEERVDRLIQHVRRDLDDGHVALVGHGHNLRALTARWVGLPVRAGALFGLDTASLSLLSHEREQPVVRSWNLVPD